MPSAIPVSIDYLRPKPFSFWRWTDDGRVAVWSDGKWIAFRAEVEAVIGHLSTGGLPPIESVILLLAACRDRWGQSNEPAGILAGLLRDLEAHVDVIRHISQAAGAAHRSHGDRALPFAAGSSRGVLKEVLKALDRVHALPKNMRCGVPALCALAATTFEGNRRRGSEEQANRIVQTLKGGIPPERLKQDAPRPGERGRSLKQLVTGLQTLYEGLCDRTLTEEDLELAQRTGLDELPEEAPIELPPFEQARALIDQLKDDDELHGLSSLARQLMAVVNIPRQPSDPDELPIGGFSDITNRGQVDRLLLSELVHDDLTLAVRIALREALYLRRDAPPTTPNGSRSLLLDVGVRMWGVSRLFATAFALAFAATTDPHFDFQSFRACADQAVPVDLLTREGLIRHLEALEPEPHPGKAIPEFLDELARKEDGTSEPVLITGEDVLSDRDFRSWLFEHSEQPIYVATVSRDGNCSLSRATGLGIRVMQEAKVSLEDLFTKRKPRLPVVEPEEFDATLPAIFGISPFPLLLTHHIPWHRCDWDYCPQQGMVMITDDGRLLQWRDNSLGARQVCERLPSSKVQWLHLDPSGKVRAAVGGVKGSPLHLLEVDLETGEQRSNALQIRSEQVQATYADRGLLCLIYGQEVEAVDLESGKWVEGLPLSLGTRWLMGRFFRQGHADYYALTVQGRAPKLEKLKLTYPGNVAHLFDSEPLESTMAFYTDRTLLNVTTGRKSKVDLRGRNLERVGGTSRDGSRMFIHAATPRLPYDARVGVSLASGKPKSETAYCPELFLHAQAHSLIGTNYNVRRKMQAFTHAAVLDDGQLALVLKKDTTAKECNVLCPELREGYWLGGVPKKCVGLTQLRMPRENMDLFPFRGAGKGRGLGYHLSKVEFRDGSQVWIDSRGLMHLRSSDTSIPEVTLVLVNEGTTAGWSSSGKFFGPKFFIGDNPSAEGDELMAHVEAFGLQVWKARMT